MAVDITMAKLGMTMEEGKLLEWTKKEKEPVRKGDIIMVIESDKVTYEVDSPGSGILAILVEPGEGIPVGTLLGRLAESEEEYDAIRGNAGSAAVPDARAGAATPAGAPGARSASRAAGESRREGPVRATPAAREIARQHGLDISALAGTGPQGRVTREDVLAVLGAAQAGPAGPDAMPAAEPTARAATPAAPVGRKRLLREEPMSGMRAAISRNMMQSLGATAQITALAEWDVTEFLGLRESLNGEGRDGFKATIPGLMVYLLGRVLKEFPLLNASVVGDRIRYWDDVNVGVAVAVPDGLVVPVVHGADRKSLKEIHAVLAGLVERARQKKLSPDEMRDGTFTLTNVGSYGGEWETVIINPPEVAILGIGRTAPKPVVRGEGIVVRQMMPVSLTYDHRVIDGEVAGRFRRRLKSLVESPGLLWAQGQE